MTPSLAYLARSIVCDMKVRVRVRLRIRLGLGWVGDRPSNRSHTRHRLEADSCRVYWGGVMYTHTRHRLEADLGLGLGVGFGARVRVRAVVRVTRPAQVTLNRGFAQTG